MFTFLKPAGGNAETCCSDIAKRRNGRLLIIFILLRNKCNLCTRIVLETCVSFVTDYDFGLCIFEI